MVSRNGYKNKLCDHGKYKNEIIKERETRLYMYNDGIIDEIKVAPDATLTNIANDQNLIAMFPEPRTDTDHEEQKKYQYAISLAMGESVLLAHAEEKLDDMKDYYKEYYFQLKYFESLSVFKPEKHWLYRRIMGPTNFTDERGTANFNLKTLSFEKVNIQNSSITTKTKDNFWNDSERQEAHSKIRGILDMEDRSKSYARKTKNIQESWKEILNRDKQNDDVFGKRKQEVMFLLILIAILSK